VFCGVFLFDGFISFHHFACRVPLPVPLRPA